MRGQGSFAGSLFVFLFYAHLFLITFLVVFLAILRINHSYPKTWYLAVLSSTGFSGFLGFVCQAFTSLRPSTAFRAAFWLSPSLTCAFGLFLAAVETPASLVASVVVLISAALQSLYACWASPRFHNACKILTVATVACPPKLWAAVFLSVVIGTLYSSFLMCGIGAATARGTDGIEILFVFLILVSLTWTMHIIKNALQVTVSHVVYMKLTCGIDIGYRSAMVGVARNSFGSICIGSITVPILSTVRGLARGVSLVSGDVDEFMFSCSDCCSGVASRIIAYTNRWGFVQVGVHRKGIKQASIATWKLFERAGMERLIESDLTSSFCFLCGMASASACALVAGIPALVMRIGYATEVAVYASLVGYFSNRVGMAWVQASVAAYYVSYAENPQGHQFDATITNYICDLQQCSQG